MVMILVGTNRAAPVTIPTDEPITCAAFISRIKRSAQKANPRFRPFKLENEMAWFILFAPKKEFGELKNDPDIALANAGAVRSKHEYFNGPLFESDDLFFNGVIIREITDDAL